MCARDMWMAAVRTQESRCSRALTARCVVRCRFLAVLDDGPVGWKPRWAGVDVFHVERERQIDLTIKSLAVISTYR